MQRRHRQVGAVVVAQAGGLAPSDRGLFLEKTGNIHAGPAYPIGIAALTFVTGFFLIKERRHAGLSDG